MITQEQKNHYQVFGFLVMGNLFAAAEIDEISRLFDEVMTEARDGKPFSGESRQMQLSLVEQRPQLSALLEDDRIYCVVEDLLGPEFVWIAGDGNYYVGDSQWHPDIREPIPGNDVIKVAFYLDPVDSRTGCLRVIPGSHHEPLLSMLQPLFKHRENPPSYPFGVMPNAIPATALASRPGDVVFFNQSLWHASFEGSARRRMFTLNFATKPTTAAQEAFHRRLYDGHLRFQQTNPYRVSDRVYHPEFLAGGGPRRRHMVDPLIQWGFR